MVTMYGEDLALIHHTGFGDFARGAAPGILQLLAKNGPPIRERLVVDLGCGGGIWARQLVLAGYSVLGVDVSTAQLSIARRQAPGARFRKASAYTVDIPACSAVTALGEVLGYCEAGGRRPSLTPLFRRVFAALEPGGWFVFDMIMEGGRSLDGRSWREEADYAVLVDISERKGAGQLRRDIVTFVRRGRAYRRREEHHRVHLESQAALTSTLGKVGFRVTVRRRYGDYPLPARRVAFLCRKP